MILVIRRASTLGRDHRRAKWRLRRATLSKRGTLEGLFQSLQNFAGDTLRRLLCENIFHVKSFFRVEVLEVCAQAPAALRDDANAAPFPVDGHEDLANRSLSR